MNQSALVPIVSNIPLTKAGQTEAAAVLKNLVNEGEIDPVEAYVKARAIIEVLTIFVKDQEVLDSTLESVERYGQEGASFCGTKLVKCETGVRYDYSECGDPQWRALADQKAAIEAKLKARENFLRNIDGSATIVDEETGEVAKLFAPAKTSATSLKMYFAK